MFVFELHQVFFSNFATTQKFINKTYRYILKSKKNLSFLDFENASLYCASIM